MPFDLAPSLPLYTFAVEHEDALLSAADLLGGAPGRRRCARLLAELHEGRPFTRRMAGEARWLIGLLGLEHVGDPDRIETDCFASIAPEYPVVAEICCLHDAMMEAFSTTHAELHAAA